MKKKAAKMHLAVLTSAAKDKFFGGNHQTFSELIYAGRKNNIDVSVLIPNALDAEKLTGYLLKSLVGEKKVWVKEELPWPDVVYNRIPNRKAEQATDVKHFKQILRKKRIPFFNTNFFYKDKLLELLNKEQRLQTTLPETVRWGDKAKFYQLLLKHDMIYLKPVDWSIGKGIFKLTKRSEGWVIEQQQLNSQCELQGYFEPSELIETLKKLLPKRAYLVQQGIELLETSVKRKCDMRTLVQKNKTGNWGVTGIGVRIAGLRAIATHRVYGGSLGDVDTVLQDKFKLAKAMDIKRELAKKSLEVAKVLDQHDQGHLGEISIDWGVDQTGRLWFFEANAKPMRFDEPHIQNKATHNVLDYALFLSKHK
ncbi:MAG: hypothetical protein RLZ12_600 [Bacillota bacterium]|jgi:hypothetical protein